MDKGHPMLRVIYKGDNQYLSIIEREVNEIIVLSGFNPNPDQHLNWYDMKNRVRKRGIDIDYLPYKLHEAFVNPQYCVLYSIYKSLILLILCQST